jgi:hypothetical protein
MIYLTRSSHRNLFLFTIVLASFFFSPPLPADEPTAGRSSGPRLDLTQEAELAAVIRDVYATMERHVRMSGFDVSFRLRSFETVPVAAYDSIPLLDAATLPGGRTLSIARASYGTSWSDEKRVQYRPRWIDWPSYLETDAGRRSAARTLGESYRGLLDRQPDRAREVGRTFYEVHAESAGESRAYRAAFVWLTPRNPEDGDLEFMVIDHVSGAIDQALVETLPVGSRTDLSPPPRRAAVAPPLFRGGIPAPDAAIGVTCRVDDGSAAGSFSEDKHRYTATDHVSGGHGPFARVRWACSCGVDCAQTCSGSMEGGHEACQEAGEVSGLCHALSTISYDFEDDHTSNASSTGSPAKCDVAMGCAWKACADCDCGTLSISVGYSGSSVSYTTSPPDAHRVTLAASHECNSCQLEEPNDPGGPGSPDDDIPGGVSCTPLLIDLDRRGFRLTGLEAPVAFDLDADGEMEMVSWTHANSGDAFLVWDRNGNGVVDDGIELFGNETPQPTLVEGAPLNGYAALYGLDVPWMGGNADGRLSAEDERFDVLRLWIDANHDGISQAGELHTLDEYGIVALAYDYKTSRRRDRHGNEFRYRSHVELADGSRTSSVDVALLTRFE